MQHREHAFPPVMAATSASSTILSVLRQAQPSAIVEASQVYLFLVGHVPAMAQTQDQVVVHLMPTGTTPAFANVTTMTTVLVLALTPFYRPVVLAAGAGERADGEHGAHVA